ncbi:hypothetical protein [Micromonospora globbae]|uniref:hypothetical protein n=1 Tax=Micromonospora globbae TaxID=1894969 RepID=UPI0011C3C240|nr:hypothetical protein [Micromonospora globbae]
MRRPGPARLAVGVRPPLPVRLLPPVGVRLGTADHLPRRPVPLLVRPGVAVGAVRAVVLVAGARVPVVLDAARVLVVVPGAVVVA